MVPASLRRLMSSRSRWRFRLRTVFIITTAIAAASAVYPNYRSWRAARARELARLVNQFNDLIDRQQYSEAVEVARQTVAKFPGNPVGQQMEIMSRSIVRMQRDADGSFEDEVQIYSGPPIVDRSRAMTTASLSSATQGAASGGYR